MCLCCGIFWLILTCFTYVLNDPQKLYRDVEIWCFSTLWLFRILEECFNIISQVKAAEWALENGIATVICNGNKDRAITDILASKKVGTFFTKTESSMPVEIQALQGI